VVNWLQKQTIEILKLTAPSCKKGLVSSKKIALTLDILKKTRDLPVVLR
jgi:hypothetical protein